MAGGGIGEAMLISAAIGGGTSAITGQDPLKGALLGAALGGAGSGIGSLLGAGGGAAAGAGAGAAGGAGAGTALGIGTEAALGGLGAGAGAGAGVGAGAASGIMPGAISAAAPAAAPAAGAGLGAAPAAGLGAGTAPAAGLSTGVAPGALTAETALTPGMSNILSGANSMLPPASISPEVLAGGATPPSGISGWWNSLSGKEKLLYGGGAGIGALGLAGGFKQKGLKDIREPYTGPLSKFKYDPSKYDPESSYLPIYRAAGGGIADLNDADLVVGGPSSVEMADGGEVDTPMSNEDYFAAALRQSLTAPDTSVGFAQGGVADLGSYSDGGRLLKGPGDGMSDNIPATIANKRPARLADGEFVVPADVVSHLGNGSTDAGAKNLYKMMDKVRRARTGTKKQGKQINPEKYLPA